jgi:tripartite-type tricarboxylate transporter receptor subunit TctC
MRRGGKWFLLVLSCFALVAHAQHYPDRPVKIVVPFPPGGNVDTSARIIAQALSEELGQPFIIENKPGAAGFIGANFVAKSNPDGYTLLVSSNSAISIAPLTNPNAPYDPLRDFAPVSMLAQTPLVIEVTPAVPAKSVTELVALARRNPGQLVMASPSSGSINHMAVELFQIATQTRFNLVHYKGNAPAVNDLLGGHAQVSFDQLTSSLQHIKAGRLRALAVMSSRRAPELPDIPTLDELGFKGLEAITFTAMMGPQGMRADVVSRLNAAVNKALQSPAVKERFAAAGAQVHGTTPDEFYQFLKKEQARWGRVINEANIKAD